MTGITAARGLSADIVGRLGRYPFVLAVRPCWRASPRSTLLLLASLAEFGTHAELVAAGGMYRHL